MHTIRKDVLFARKENASMRLQMDMDIPESDREIKTYSGLLKKNLLIKT